MVFCNTLAKWENALYDGPPSPSKPRNTTLDGLGGPSYFRRLKCYGFLNPMFTPRRPFLSPSIQRYTPFQHDLQPEGGRLHTIQIE